MKKHVNLSILSGLMLTASAFATGDSNINYKTLQVPHGQEIILDLANGNPNGMKPGLLYNLTCQVVAPGEIGMAINESAMMMNWSRFTVDGKQTRATQFKVNDNTTLEFTNLNFSQLTGRAFSQMHIVNLDNTADFQLNCHALPVFL